MTGAVTASNAADRSTAIWPPIFLTRRRLASTNRPMEIA